MRSPSLVCHSSTEDQKMSKEAIRFTCPACGKNLRAQSEQAGRRVKCPGRGCGRVMHVPGTKTAIMQSASAPAGGGAWILAGAIGLVIVLAAAVGLVFYSNRPRGGEATPVAEETKAPGANRNSGMPPTPVSADAKADTTPKAKPPASTSPKTETVAKSSKPVPSPGSTPSETETVAKSETAAKAPKPAPSPSSKPGSAIRLSDLNITKTTFEPPSVEFTVRVDLAGGKLLEAWASVGVPDAGKPLDIFAGALDAGLLSVNGIDFANPSPALKAQPVSMKKSDKDDTLYVCVVRYPKLMLDNPETEFTIVAAVDKDKKIMKTNAATARVNLKTGKALSDKNGKQSAAGDQPLPTPAAFAGKWTGVERYQGALLTILLTIDAQGQARYQRTRLEGAKIEADTGDRSSKLTIEDGAATIKLLDATYRCEMRDSRLEMTLVSGTGPRTFSFGRREN